ncbi:MAG: hypothetical protein IKC82_02115 [Lentisphaeria bacterium]|nr:hypothetical protein [Lentisphaeria bacterium]
MKRHIISIKSIFFAIFCLLLPMMASADVPLAPGITFRTSVNDGSAEFLKNIIRQLDRYARSAKLKRSSRSITIIPSTGKWGYTGKNTLRIPGNISLWQQDTASRRMIYALLASHRLNFDFPPASQGVAEWIVNGIDSEITAAATSGQYIHANRQYPLLAEITAITGKMPDFSAMCKMGMVKNPLIRDILGEQARLMLRVSSQLGTVRELFEYSCRDRSIRDILRLTGADRQGSSFHTEAAGVIWTQYSPMPAGLALKKVAGLNEIYIQEADGNGILTGNFIKCNHRALAEALQKKRQDADKLRMDFASGYVRLGKMLPRDEQRLCGAIVIAVSRFGMEENSQAADDFAAAEKALKQALKRRSERAGFFNRTLDRNSPLPDHYGRVLQAVSYDSRACSDEELKFFRETLNNYLR